MTARDAGTPAVDEALVEVLATHRYALGYEGIVCDGEMAWLQCTCGWKLNYEMPEDDIVHAEDRWQEHIAVALAPVIAAQRAAALREAADEFDVMWNRGHDNSVHPNSHLLREYADRIEADQ